MRLSVGFVSLGCPKNLVDTERMMNLLSEKQILLTGNESEADVVVINTCGFLESAKNESLDTIQEFVDKKKEGGLRGVVVAGCMTERYLDLMRDRYPDVDAFLQTREFSKITEVVEAIASGEKSKLKAFLVGERDQLQGHSELTDYVVRTPLRRSYAYVKIAEGCNRTCSFCIIPKLRGKLHSRSDDGVFDEVRQLASQGVKEVILIAQDLTSYGRDRSDGSTLLSLLQKIEGIEGIAWVRLMYNYPRFFSEELIDFLANSKKFSRYLDIPFQHISDSVLKQMRRPESSAEIRSLVSKLRNKIPDISLRTTLMVGFPGETDKDFADLLSFVQESAFDQLGTFTYMQEANTPSYDLPNQVSEEVKASRLHEIMTLQKKTQKVKLKSKLKRSLNVLIDAVGEKTKQGQIYLGRHSGQAPEIDGITYVVSEQQLEVGEIYPVEIGKIVGDYDLLGSPEDDAFYLNRQRKSVQTA